MSEGETTAVAKGVKDVVDDYHDAPTGERPGLLAPQTPREVPVLRLEFR